MMSFPRMVALVAVLAVAVAAALQVSGCGEDERRAEPPGEPPPLALVVQDDAEFLHRPERLAETLDDLEAIGADVVRVTAGWSDLAPESGSGAPPSGFDGSDPAHYEQERWANLDRFLAAVAERDLIPLVDIAFWAPMWGQASRNEVDRPRRDVDPELFADFAAAVARRYQGDWVPPGAEDPLPAVRLFTLWNEPNHPGFLIPQWRDRDGEPAPSSPHHYREMVHAAYPQVKQVQPESTVLVGGLASLGDHGDRPTGGVPPLLFLREMACVDDDLEPLGGPECEGFRPVPGDGYAHHPYSLRVPPDRPSPASERDNARAGDNARLVELLDSLASRGRIDPAMRDVWVTEFGYETDPPDPGARYDPETAARLSARAEALASREPRMRSWSQFLVRDLAGDVVDSPSRGPDGEKMLDWQSGFLFSDGRPKPLRDMLALPVHAELAANREALVWGRVRPGTGRREVRIEVGAEGRWDTVWEGETDGAGIVEREVAVPAGASVRIARRDDDGSWVPGPAVEPVEDLEGG